MLKQACELAALGIAVHWLHAKSKRPIGKDWSEKPVASIADLKASWEEGNNVGIRPGQWSKVAGAYLHVIDLDIHDTSVRDEAYKALGDLLPELNPRRCPTVISGSGGESRHFYFFTDKPFSKRILAKSQSKSEGKHLWQIELYGTGTNLVAPPSIHPDTGQPYRWLRPLDIEEIQLVGPRTMASSAIERLTGESDEESPAEPVETMGLSVEEVRGYLADLPNTDLDYDEWYNVMASVNHEASGRSKEERAQFQKAFLEWSRQSSKHDDDTAAYKFRTFRNEPGKRLRTFRSVVREVEDWRREQSIEDEFDDLEDEPKTAASIFDDILGDGKPSAKKVSDETPMWESPLAPKHVRYLNKRHALVRFNAKSYIVDLNNDPEQPSVKLGDERSLHLMYRNRTEDVPIEDKNTGKSKIKTFSWSDLWLSSQYRRFYPAGICFNPKKNENGRLNLWRGWQVEPDTTGDCSLLVEHIEKVLCRGVQEHATAFLDFMAHMIQRPWERPTFSLVMRGDMGAGKDTPFRYLSEIMGAHYLTVGRNSDISGRFNSHLMGRILVHLQEGFYAGDRQQQNYMKFLLDSPKINIEQKGVDIFSVRAYHRTVISSNEDWVAPASWGERRYFVLDVDNYWAPGVERETRARSKAYFTAIDKQMQSGGLGAFMHLLQTRDLSEFDIRQPPRTDALASQILQGLRNIDRWWYNTLEVGSIDTMGSSHAQIRSVWERGEYLKPTDEVFDAYDRWRQGQRYLADGITRHRFAIEMKHLCPSVRNERKRVKADSGAGAWRERFLVFPHLEACRRDFAKLIGGDLQWDDASPESDDDDDLL